eukprot:Em0002g1804a
MRRVMKIAEALLSVEIVLFAAARGHYHPIDPYAVPDPNNGYPHHFCDLNDDEYGRPYLGPFDQYLTDSSVFPVIPPPRDHSETAAGERPDDYKPHGGPHKRQARDLLTCITSNECANAERCNGSGTQYDSCSRRCTCRNGVLVNCCRVRKEWRSMTQAERCLYISTLVTASTRQPWKNCYDQLIQIHSDYFDAGIHGGPSSFFLPWHRWYLLSIENLLRKINCNVTVPYWDWSLESQIWTNSIVWNAQCGIGGDGIPVRTGPFRPSVWTTPNGRPLVRRFNRVLPDCASVAMGQRMGIPQFTSWHRFVSSNLHNTFHCNMGGVMCTSEAANDPVFFFHHGFLDKLWADWQDKGTEFKNLARYSQNTEEMPGAFGTTAKMVYDLLNLPGCVQVCFQQSDRPCCSNTTYSPLCYRDMSSRDYSPLKLARLVHRPFPRVSDEAFNLFHTTYEDQVLSNRFSDLMNAPDKLIEVLGSSGYSTQLASVYQPTHGYLNFDNYLYRSEALDKYTKDSDYPSQCLPYIYGKAD